MPISAAIATSAAHSESMFSTRVRRTNANINTTTLTMCRVRKARK
jgi:hypothetical protein